MATAILGAGFKVGSTFLPYLAIVNVAIELYGKIEINKDQCEYLVKRAGRVLGAIDTQVDRNPPRDMRDNLNRLMRELTYIRDLMGNLAAKGLIKSLLAADDISLQIDDGHRRLSDCLACFQVAAHIDAAKFMAEAENARASDERQLRTLLGQLMAQRNRDAQVLKELQLGQEDLIETMLAVKKHLLNNADEGDTTARKVLSVGMESIQRVSGRQAPAQVPDWVITSYDVEIEKNRKLGTGGFGVVSRGTWNGTVVAVKQLMQETNQDLLLKEILIWEKLRHPHVLPFFGASITASPPFIVSRYMKNGNAMAYLRRNPNAKRTKICYDVALGMSYIHSRNILHGDLKGLNVLIDDAGNGCIADFGMSKIMEDARSRATMDMSTLQGTLRFVSPETMTRGTVSKQTDVYSYGMTVYQIYTGEEPFLELPNAAIIDAVARQQRQLTRPGQQLCRDHGLKEDIWHLVMDCSSFQPQRRPMFGEIVRVLGKFDNWSAKTDAGHDHLTNLFQTLGMDSIHVGSTSNQSLSPPQDFGHSYSSSSGSQPHSGSRTAYTPSSQPTTPEPSFPPSKIFSPPPLVSMEGPAVKKSPLSKFKRIFRPDAKPIVDPPLQPVFDGWQKVEEPYHLAQPITPATQQPVQVHVSPPIVVRPLAPAPLEPIQPAQTWEPTFTPTSRAVELKRLGKLIITVDVGDFGTSVSYISTRLNLKVRDITMWPGTSEARMKVPTHILYNTEQQTLTWGFESQYVTADSGIKCSRFKLPLAPNHQNPPTPSWDTSVLRKGTTEIFLDYVSLLLDHAKSQITAETGFVSDIADAEVILPIPHGWSPVELNKAVLEHNAVQRSCIGDAHRGNRLKIISSAEAALTYCYRQTDLYTVRSRQNIMILDTGASIVSATIYKTRETRVDNEWQFIQWSHRSDMSLGSMALDSRFETLYTRLLEKHSGSHLDAASKAYFQHQFTETEKLTFNPVNKGAPVVKQVRALYNFSATEPGELSFSLGDIIQVNSTQYKEWWSGTLNGVSGIFPNNYVERIADPSAPPEKMSYFTCFNVEDPHDPTVGLLNGELVISESTLRWEVFDPVIDKIGKLVLDLLKEHNGRVDVVCMVGGFSKNDYLFEKVKAIAGRHVSQVVRPNEGDMAVSRGAAMYSLLSLPPVTQFRCPKTYLARLPSSVHHDPLLDEDQFHIPWPSHSCQNCLRPLVQKDDIFTRQEYLKIPYTKESTNSSDTELKLIIYTMDSPISHSKNTYIQRSQTTEICTWTIELAPLLTTQPRIYGEPIKLAFEIGLLYDSSGLTAHILHRGSSFGSALLD